jgi:hypothetical protein
MPLSPWEKVDYSHLNLPTIALNLSPTVPHFPASLRLFPMFLLPSPHSPVFTSVHTDTEHLKILFYQYPSPKDKEIITKLLFCLIDSCKNSIARKAGSFKVILLFTTFYPANSGSEGSLSSVTSGNNKGQTVGFQNVWIVNSSRSYRTETGCNWNYSSTSINL